ncbi:MAG TPA: zf-HC2 domain-containing protein [Sphingomicrobium sp.]|jgi:anti-sigma factor RsiW|nr:zf-HC2 domain-containing protein [Sphingomicrobium sp.]
MPNPIETEIQPHHDAEELLPWYITGQLEGDELALVETHLSSCAHCRRQLAFERQMVEEFAGLTPEIDTGWARLKQRLGTREPVAVREPERVRQGLWDRIASDATAFWQTLTRPAVAALATAQLVFVAMAGTILFSLSQPSYRALGSAPLPRSANVIAMFRADTTESEMRDLLRANGASVVGGPTSTDAFLLRIAPASRQVAIAKLRSNRHVLMAQPIDSPTS